MERAHGKEHRSRIRELVKHRSVLNLLDMTPEEIRYLLQLAAELKTAWKQGAEKQHLKGKKICLIFEKPSTRTRSAFEVAAYDQGAHVTYLGPEGSHIGHKESPKDTARVLGRIYNAIEYRGFSQKTVEIMAKYAGVPVYNGLTDEFHPTQVLADLLTMREHCAKPLEKIAFCFLGDGGNNVSNSLLAGGCMMGMDVRICAPKRLWPKQDLLEECRRIAQDTGARLLLTDQPEGGVRGVDFLYTDVWLSMGESEEQWGQRIQLLLPYQVNNALVELTGNPEVRFLHCLPSLHNRETEVGERIYQKTGLEALEVTDEVFESERSIVFAQAENRMHTIKAIMVATLGG
jgi:ornithine carbamoyltransferase